MYVNSSRKLQHTYCMYIKCKYLTVYVYLCIWLLLYCDNCYIFSQCVQVLLTCAHSKFRKYIVMCKCLYFHYGGQQYTMVYALVSQSDEELVTGWLERYCMVTLYVPASKEPCHNPKFPIYLLYPRCDTVCF